MVVVALNNLAYRRPISKTSTMDAFSVARALNEPAATEGEKSLIAGTVTRDGGSLINSPQPAGENRWPIVALCGRAVPRATSSRQRVDSKR